MARQPVYLNRARRNFCFGAVASVAVLAASQGRVIAKPKEVRPSDLLGKTQSYVATGDDTLMDIARRYKLGFTELMAANPGTDPWLPGLGKKLVIPTGHLPPRAKHEGLVLNLSDQRVYYFPVDGAPPRSMPMGIGRQGWSTPLGRTTVERKKSDPTWFIPKSIRAKDPELPKAIGPGPDNPLGRHAIYLGWPSYLIHGTNKPSGVGRRASHGCIRMYPEDIEQLFNDIPIGTPVTVVDQAAKIGWHDGNLLLEVHPSQSQADRVEAGESFPPEPVPELEYLLIDAAGREAKKLDWKKIRQIVRERRGIPIAVLKP
ncbi:MAG: L,D-transpeptidase family protein [Rhodospirillales bacterium]|nr:L,D-transpeptidase family protein [Rhodospirillales bacterium]